MGRQTAKDAYLALLQASSGKSEAQAQAATLELIDIIADMVESGTATTEVTGTLPDGPEAADGEGSITIP